MKIELMSNAEIKIYLKEMENEYEALQMKIKQCMLRMEELDKNYVKAKEVIQKRTKGFI